jgi:hypothetical protein
MKKKAIRGVIILILIISGIRFCDNAYKYNKDKHQHTEYLGRHIFKEKFETFGGGVLMTNDYAYYLTDSLTFRKFVGQCDEKELYRFALTGDTIIAVKYSRHIQYPKETAIDSAFFSIKELKKDGDFE